MTDTNTPQWAALAHLMRPQGRRGELLAEPLTDLPDIFTPGRPVWLSQPGTNPAADAIPTHNLEEHWLPTGKNSGRIVLKLSGCDSISSAELLAGLDLLIPATDLPQLDPDTFFVGDLLGCQLYDRDTLAGTVTDLHFPTTPDGRTRLEDAAPLLAIQLPTMDENDEPILVPFIRAWLLSVDLSAKRITMDLPPGLLDSTVEESSPTPTN